MIRRLNPMSVLFCLLPLGLLVVPLPMKAEHLQFTSRLMYLLSAYAVLVAALLLVELIERLVPPKIMSRTVNFSFLLFAVALACLLLKQGNTSAFAGLSALACAISAFLLFRRQERLLSAAGPMSLLVVVNVVLATELALRAIPASALIPQLQKADKAAKPFDRTLNVYEKNGFRGRIFNANSAHKGLRIFTTGGSSTYGMPMRHPSSTYAGVLERLLEERRPNEDHEVYNAGVPGFGITQIIDVLERRLLSLRPDVVTVCAWFNDAALGSGWYGFPGHSEADALKMLRTVEWIKGLPGLSAVLSSRSFAWYGFYLIKIVGSVANTGDGKNSRVPDRPRMTPEEFATSLRHVAAMGEKHNFLPVFIFEPEHRTRPHDEAIEKNRYFQAMVKVAKEHDIPLVDTLRPFGERRHEWLFYDVIHSNEEAHRTIAEAIYQTLFLGENNTEKGQRFLAARGVLPKDGYRELLTQWRAADLRMHPKLELSIRAPRLAPGDRNHLQVGVFAGAERIASFGPITSQPADFLLDVGRLQDLPPLVDLTFRSELNPELTRNSFALFPGGFVSPVYIRAVGQNSVPFRRSLLQINQKKFEITAPGFSVVLLTPKTGRVASVRYLRFLQRATWPAEIEELDALISNSSEDGIGPLLVGTLAAAGSLPSSPTLMKVLRRCGASGRKLESDESMVLIGYCDSPGQAVESIAKGKTEAEVGEREAAAVQLIDVVIRGAAQPYRRFSE